MRTVSTKKELLKAIEDGETRIDVTDKKLFLSCKLAAKYCNHKHPKTAIMASVGKKDDDSVPMDAARETGVSGEIIAAIIITVVIATTAIAIVYMLKKKKKGDVLFCFPGLGCVKANWDDN